MRLLKKLAIVLMLVLLLTVVVGVASNAFADDVLRVPMFGNSCSSQTPVGMSAAVVWVLMCVFMVW
ncbi:MAG: hypothetical protein Q8O51_02930 [bacterium]|nr:hypothetical protein [bacterium]